MRIETTKKITLYIIIDTNVSTMVNDNSFMLNAHYYTS